MTQYEITDLICIYYAKMTDGIHKEYRNYPSDFRLLADVYGKKYKGYTNRKDIFDAFFDNGRKGWYQRTLREQGLHFEESYNLYKDTSISDLKSMVDEARTYLVSLLEQRETGDQFDSNIDDFLNNDFEDCVRLEKDMEKRRETFLDFFPPEHIKEIQLEKYAIGTKGTNVDWNQTFCYQLETVLKPLGSMRGSNALKFGIYWDKEKHQYIVAKKFLQDRTIEQAFDFIKTEIDSLIKSGKNKNFQEIDKNTLSPMFKSKILVTYYPDLYLNIYDKDDVESILFRLNIPFSTNLPLEKEKQKLLDFKNRDERMQTWSNYVFACFLLRYYRPQIISKNSATKTITRMDFSIVGKHETKRAETGRDPDYRKAYEAKVAVGISGEKMVESYEKERLRKAKFQNWNDVKIISTENPRAGYDVESFDEVSGHPLHIEVKTTSKTTINVMDFYLTDNEYQKFLSDPHHVIYYLCGIKNENVKLYIITKRDFAQVEPEPVLYRVNLNIESKEMA